MDEYRQAHRIHLNHNEVSIVHVYNTEDGYLCEYEAGQDPRILISQDLWDDANDLFKRPAIAHVGDEIAFDDLKFVVEGFYSYGLLLDIIVARPINST